MKIGDRVRVPFGEHKKIGTVVGFYNNNRNCLVKLTAPRTIINKKPASWIESFFVMDVKRC